MTRRRLTQQMRPYLTPRMLGLHLLALVLVAGMGAAALWQYRSYTDQQADEVARVANARPVPLDTLLRPDQGFTAAAHARPVVVQGVYGERQVLVGAGGSRPWLVAPLVTDTGSAILVVRGLAAPGAQQAAPPPPRGRVRLVGSLQPSQGLGGPDTDLTDDRVPTLSTAALISEFPTDLYSGFVVLTRQSPPSHLPTVEPPLPQISATAGLRNLMYTLQWWVFAGFVVFMWWRIVRDEARVR
jgi:surfeit locus 1 family protein